MNRQISRLALASLVLLSSLVVATTYWQVWAAPGLANRQDNEIQRVAQFQINRGKILAANGTVLATNVRREVSGQTLFFRRYPRGGFASQTVGYSTQSRARSGLERELNAYLTASNKNLSTIVDTLGDRLRGTTIRGNDVVLNLRVRPQRVAQTLLREACGAAVVLNPKTGAVYVMASSPTFDPNQIERQNGYDRIQARKAPCSPSAPLLNRATQGLYPPGSIFKAVTTAAALESGKFDAESRFDDPGYCIQYGKPVFNAGNHDMSGPSAYGNVSLFTAFENSINSVFCQIGQQLGAGAVLEQAKRFGFYSVPPVELPSGERSPSGLYRSGTRRLYDPASPDTDVDPGRLAFGQERLLVTPLQMAMVAGAIANEGTVMKPRLVGKIVSPGGKVVVRSRPQRLSQAMKPETAAAINAMMVAAVESGTGGNARITGVTVGGKTGTAETGSPGVYHTWFIFFAPAENPILAGAVVVESQPGGFGGTVAAPIAKEIMQAILSAASNADSQEAS